MRLGKWLRSGEGIGWPAAGTIPNSLYRVLFCYFFLACVRVCVFSSHLCALCYCSFLLLIFVLFCLVLMLSSELCRCSSDLFLGSCPADHVPNWQLLILLGIVEARSVNVKNTTTTTTITTRNLLTLGREFESRCCHTNWDFFYKINK